MIKSVNFNFSSISIYTDNLKGRLTVRYRFCYTLDMLIANRIVSQRGCSRSQRNPLINDRWEANKHQPSSYPMVI